MKNPAPVEAEDPGEVSTDVEGRQRGLSAVPQLDVAVVTGGQHVTVLTIPSCLVEFKKGRSLKRVGGAVRNLVWGLGAG